MQIVDGRFVASPTDLANFLTCRHKTALDLRVAAGLLEKPKWEDPLAELLRQRGEEHEKRYVDGLRAAGLTVEDFGPLPPKPGAMPLEERLEQTRQAMRNGIDVIVQSALANAGWLGYADVLRKTPDGYEVIDTKLTRETRGGTIVQLCTYTDLLAQVLNARPAHFHVVTPVASEPYRFNEYGGYFRQAKSEFSDFVLAQLQRVADPATTYPRPVDHCEVCRWSQRCDAQRRADDDLSLVHGLGRLHSKELTKRGIGTLAALASEPMPLSWNPSRGSVETYARLREQARLQLEQRLSGEPRHECLPIEAGFGLSALPAPRPGDLFLDLEGDPFGRPSTGATAGEGNREYLFGIARVNGDGSLHYTARWSFSDAEERDAFDATMADIMAALAADPGIHIYHYNHYEVTAFKRLAGRYVTREADLDRLLRGRRFLDLYAVVRRAVRAGVESYSIKELEPFYHFTREVELHSAGDQRRMVEVALESGDFSKITNDVRATVEGYNKDDVRSTVELRIWLEALRAMEIGRGADVPRPGTIDDRPPERVDEKAQRVEQLRQRLLRGGPDHFLLAYLLDWHRREDKAEWWDYYRLRELPEDDLLDEPRAVAGLSWVTDVGVEKRSVIRRYSFPEQEFEIRPSDTLKTQDGKVFSDDIRGLDRNARTIDLLVGPSRLGFHPRALFAHKFFDKSAMEESLMALGEQVAQAGSVEALPPGPARTLLLRQSPTRKSGVFAAPPTRVLDYARAIVTDLDSTALPIQGPPGSGKTYTGARMIEECVEAGFKVGVTGTSHKVIRNLLKEVGGSTARVAHLCRSDEEEQAESVVQILPDNDAAHHALSRGDVNVLGGTAWLWARPEFAGSVDVLFVDEAGQVSLANALGVARAGRSMVLLGDPQQLDQPTKGSHPRGIGASALAHVLGDTETMPADRGLFLGETWRLAPRICSFTSELFYDGKLVSRQGLERQRLAGTGAFDGAGLRVIAVEHHGNRNASDEEAATVADIVEGLLRTGSHWVDAEGESHQIEPRDIRVVTPFNAQVARIRDAFELRTSNFKLVPVGTVDKFQGQEAAVVIYSMATSHPEDAPKGMEFLYSLNRLNVATSRARCAVFLVASPLLFEPDCRTPRQMKLANALCRFRELARRDNFQLPTHNQQLTLF